VRSNPIEEKTITLPHQITHIFYSLSLIVIFVWNKNSEILNTEHSLEDLYAYCDDKEI